MSDSERRSSERTARPIMGRYRRPGQLAWHTAPLKDLGRSGARLLSEESFEVGKPLELWIGPPLFAEPIQIMTQIKWIKLTNKGTLKITELGLEFGELKDHLQKQINDGVKRFIHLSMRTEE